MDKSDLKCPECESTWVYTRVNGTIVCRTCGNQWRLDSSKGNDGGSE